MLHISDKRLKTSIRSLVGLSSNVHGHLCITSTQADDLNEKAQAAGPCDSILHEANIIFVRS